MRARCFQIFAASLLLAIWIVTPLLAVAHVALEEHSYCAEHERLEEAKDAHAPQSTAAGTFGESEDSAKLSPIAAGESSSAHSGCGFADSFTRECIDDAARSHVVASAAAYLDVSACSQASERSAVAILRFAPKSSPPRLT